MATFYLQTAEPGTGQPLWTTLRRLTLPDTVDLTALMQTLLAYQLTCGLDMRVVQAPDTLSAGTIVASIGGLAVDKTGKTVEPLVSEPAPNPGPLPATPLV